VQAGSGGGGPRPRADARRGSGEGELRGAAAARRAAAPSGSQRLDRYESVGSERAGLGARSGHRTAGWRGPERAGRAAAWGGGTTVPQQKPASVAL